MEPKPITRDVEPCFTSALSTALMQHARGSIKDISDLIVYDSLECQENNTAVSEIELELSASWISREEGTVDITKKITSKFDMGKINTLTPKALIASWPKFGERIHHQLFPNQSKYCFGPCKIKEENQLHFADIYEKSTPLLKISDSLPTFRVRKAWMDAMINICYGYDQYRKETIRTTIRNCAVNSGIKKKVSFNLQNVQEFLENNFVTSFFSTNVGKEAFKYALDMIGSFMLFSMRNKVFSFLLPLHEKLLDLKTCDWVKIKDNLAKITDLEILASCGKRCIKGIHKLIKYADV